MGWTVTETRGKKVLSQTTEPDREAAINVALGMAETDGVLREDNVPEGPGVPNYTRSELRAMLEQKGHYEDGDVSVRIKRVP